MLLICFGTYLVLGLPVILLLWTALTASRMHDMEVEEAYDRQRFYQIASAISNFKGARGEFDLIKDYASI